MNKKIEDYIKKMSTEELKNNAINVSSREYRKVYINQLINIELIIQSDGVKN